MVACVADVASLEQQLTPQLLHSFCDDIIHAPLVMLDGNLSEAALQVGVQPLDPFRLIPPSLCNLTRQGAGPRPGFQIPLFGPKLESVNFLCSLCGGFEHR